MFKKGLDILLVLGLIILSQLPVVLVWGMHTQGASVLVQVAVGLLLSAVVVGVYLFVGYRKGLLTKSFSQWYQHRFMLMTLLSILAMMVVAILASMIIRLEGAETTRNQMIVQEAIKQLPKMVTFMSIVVIAPIGEEIICRGIIPGLFCDKRRIWGHVLGTLVFAALHGPTNIGSWLLYGGMGAVFAVLYHRTKHLEYSILSHALNNGLSFLLMMLFT